LHHLHHCIRLPVDVDWKSIPSLLAETLNTIVDKVRIIRNPVEAAFFLWVNLAYLQPFADGNKRTGRLSANMPLMLYNCAPLSFLDVERSDHATAMLGIHEQRNVAAAVDLFEFIYRRSAISGTSRKQKSPSA